MTTMHVLDQNGRPVGLDEVDDVEELSRAVIDGAFEQRWIVDVSPEGATCRTCDHDCRHAERVERALTAHGLLEGA